MSRITETTDALVLASADSRDDRIVHLLTDASVRLPAVARRARRSARRFRGHIDPLTLAQITVTMRDDRALADLEEASARETFAVVRGDLVRYALATTMAEAVLHLIPEHAAEPGAYDLVLRAWRYLDAPSHHASEDLLLLFELRLLTLAGLLPGVAAIPGLPPEAARILDGWLTGRWQPLAGPIRRQTAGLLERVIEEASGRALRSRPFLDAQLAARPS